MSTTPPRSVTGACVLRRNAVTWTTNASFGSDAIALASFGAISTTTASLNVPSGQLRVVIPLELCSSPAANGTAFFSTTGTFTVPLVGGTQIVKWESTSAVWPPAASVPRMT